MKFSEQGKWWVKLTKYDEVEWGKKWHNANDFWTTPWLISYFLVLLFYIARTWLLMRSLAEVFPLKSTLSGKFQPFNVIDGRSKCWKKNEFPKISIKMKYCKAFTRPKQRAALRKLISLPQPTAHQVKSYFVFGTNIFLPRCTEQTFAFKVLQECIYWSSRNGAVQMFLLKLNRNLSDLFR